jgi:hypothetical protein
MIHNHIAIMTKLTFIKIDIAEMSMTDLAAVISSVEDYGYSVLSSSFLKGTNELGTAYQICVLTCRRPSDKARYTQCVWPVHVNWLTSSSRNKTKANIAAKAQLDLKQLNGGQIIFVNPEDFIELDEQQRHSTVCCALAAALGANITNDMFVCDDHILAESGVTIGLENAGIFDPVY